MKSVFITSPNFPRNYDVDSRELWNVVAPLNQTILMELTKFDLEDIHDYVDVYTGTRPHFAKSELMIDRLSGNNMTTLNHTTYWDHVWIEFTSDHSMTSAGFNMSISAYDKGISFT